MKKLFLFLFMGVFAYSAFAETGHEPKCEMVVYADPEKQFESKCQLLKRWALSVCLANNAGNYKTRSDANQTARLHVEAASISYEEFDKFNSLIDRYIAKDFRAFYFESMKPPPELNGIERCLNLFDSAELDSLVVRVLKDREKAEKN